MSNSSSMLSASAIDDVVSGVHRASDGPGTDEEGIFKALQVLNRNIADINLASTLYKKKVRHDHRRRTA